MFCLWKNSRRWRERSCLSWRPAQALFPSVRCLHSYSCMMRPEEPGDLSNGPPSVDSSLVCGPIFSDVCFRQWHWTAHLSQLRAPLNKHIHHGPISNCTLVLLLLGSLTSTEGEKHNNHLRVVYWCLVEGCGGTGSAGRDCKRTLFRFCRDRRENLKTVTGLSYRFIFISFAGLYRSAS